jgi:hypothetical protein
MTEVSKQQNEDNQTNSQCFKLNRSQLETSESVKLVDSLKVSETTTLDMFCYNKCDNEDADYVKRCRGVVFSGDKVVLQGFSYTPEFNETNGVELSEIFGNDMSNVLFYESIEGAIIRLFNFENKWFITTHRKLDAFKSKWSSRESFGLMFKKALQSEFDTNPDFMNFVEESTGDDILYRFYNKLDKNLSYMFLVANNSENRIVCLEPTRPRTYFVGTFDSEFNFSIENNTCIPSPNKCSFSSVSQLTSFVESVKPENIQGVICFLPNNTQVKVLNSSYQDYFKVRNNEPSVKFRYLQVRNDTEMRHKICDLYPNHIDDFEKYESHINSICKNIYTSYVNRFIEGKFVTVPTEEYEVMQICHTWHKQDRQYNRISMDKIYEVFNSRKPVSINHMIRRYVLELNKKDSGVENPNNVVENSTVNTRPYRRNENNGRYQKREYVRREGNTERNTERNTEGNTERSGGERTNYGNNERNLDSKGFKTRPRILKKE